METSSSDQKLVRCLPWAVAHGAGNSIFSQLTFFGPVFLLLHLAAGVASRLAHRFVDAVGDEERAAAWLWRADGVLFALLAVAAYQGLEVAVIAVFIILDTLHNVWRPVQLGRIDTHSQQETGATLLSIESQARRFMTVVAAPLLGLAVDAARTTSAGSPFWPVGVAGVVVAIVCLATARAATAR